MTEWEIKGREFGNCNCSYGCPCVQCLPTRPLFGFGVYAIERTPAV
jgi:hypothetical protein